MEYEVDHTKLKYVLYARKSTDDPERQARSIPDQIAECTQLAKRLNLTIVGEPLREEKSAKKPGKRPVFRQMLKDRLVLNGRDSETRTHGLVVPNDARYQLRYIPYLS